MEAAGFRWKDLSDVWTDPKVEEMQVADNWQDNLKERGPLVIRN